MRNRIGIKTSNEAVLLLQFIESNAEPLFALIDQNRAHLSQFDDTTAEKYPDFESVRQSIVNPSNPDKIRLGIWHWGDLVGTINLTPQEDRVYEIGYWIGSQFCDRGLATLAAKRLVDYALRNFECDQVVGNAHYENRASHIVLIKAGLKSTGNDGVTAWFATDKKE